MRTLVVSYEQALEESKDICIMRDENMMDFGKAVKDLKEGKRVYRDGWNGKGMWLELQVPDEHSKMTLPYIYMKTVTGDLVPWIASQTDILSEDWIEYT